jgi:uncharacterized membrane protein
MNTYNHKDEKPLSVLFSELSRGLSNMFRQEVELAKAELSQKAKQAVRDAVYLIAGAILAFGGFLVLLGMAVAALATIMPVWLSALIVGVVACAAAYSLIQKGISDLKKRSLKPEQTVETIKESGKWIKQQV